MSKPILTYFDREGRAEAIRLALHLAGIDFEDRRLKLDDMSYKKESPTGKLPMLEINNRKYVEDIAILMYAGRLGGLVPSNRIDLLRSSMIIHFADSMWGPLLKCFDASSGSLSEIAAEAQNAYEELFESLEKLIDQPRADVFVVGESKTVADLVIYVWVEILKTNPFGVRIRDFETAFPSMWNIHKAISNDDGVKHWRFSRQGA